MPFQHKTFDVEISYDVSLENLRWPLPGEAGHDSGLGLNREYEDFRGASWKAAQAALDEERKFFIDLEVSSDPELFYEDFQESRFQEGGDTLFGLDIGVAAAVLSISAAKCIPFTSCNGTALFGRHQETYPLIAFCAKKEHVELLLQVAREAKTGIHSTEHGELVVYSKTIVDMMTFAHLMITRRKSFRSLKFSAKNTSKEMESSNQDQLKLF